MAKKTDGFNLSQTIRDYRSAHRGVSARKALDAIKRAYPNEKINESTFKSTFYKLAGAGKRKVIKRRKPAKFVPGEGSAEAIMKAGLEFIRLAGSTEAARERLIGLEALIETAKAVE